MPQESFTVCIPLIKSSTLTLGDFPCYRAPKKLEEGNIFTGACQSFCPQGYLWYQVLSGRYLWYQVPSGVGISGTRSLHEGISGNRSFLGDGYCWVCVSPWGWWVCPGGLGTHTLDMGPGIKWVTVGKRVVCILLECFLVGIYFEMLQPVPDKSHLIHSVFIMIVEKNTNVLHDTQYVQFFLGKTEDTHIALQGFALQNPNERFIRRLLAVQNILAYFGCYIACKKLLTRKQQWIGSEIGEITSLYPWSRLSPGGVKRVFRFLWHQTHT